MINEVATSKYWGEYTNNGMDYWNGILDWTTGMSFLTVFALFAGYISLLSILNTYIVHFGNTKSAYDTKSMCM